MWLLLLLRRGKKLTKLPPKLLRNNPDLKALETGNTNMVIWASVMERFRAVLLQGQLLKFKGVVEREGRVIHVVAGHGEDASHLLADSVSTQQTFKSRDFH